MPNDPPYNSRRDLTSSEINTIKYYIDSGEEINAFLRGTTSFEASHHVYLLKKAHNMVVADHSTENQNAEKYGKFILDPGKWVSCLAPVNQPQ